MTTRCRPTLLAALPFLALSVGAPSAAEDVVRPNDKLVADGLPPIPKEIEARVGAYLEARSATLLDWRPGRRSILISTRFGEAPQLHEVAMPGGARRQITFEAEPVQAGRFRPVRGDGLLYTKDAGGGEWYQLYWRDEKTGKANRITDGKSRNQGGPFSPSGKWLAYGSTKRNGKDSDIYVVDPADPSTERRVLEAPAPGWSAASWSPDEKSLLVSQYLSANESKLHLLDLASGKTTQITPESAEKVAWRGGRLSADGRGVYVTTDQGSEFARLAYLDLATGKLDVLTRDLEWDVQSLELSDDGGKLAFTVNEGGTERLAVMDTRTKKRLPLPTLPPGVIGSLRFHPAGRELAFTLSSARSPSDVYSVDVTAGAAGKVTRWTESETGGLSPESFSEPQAISWKSFDGRTITGFLYLPPSRHTGPRPVLVNIHGGPESQAQPGFLGRSNFLLDELGIALILPNVRGSSGFGKTFLALDNADKREDSVKDIGALLDWIATRKELDASRVAVTGGSYGGYMTLASMTHYDARLKCGIDIVGISSFVTFLESTESYRRDLRRVEYGDERDPKMREKLVAISPLTNASRITKPLFVVQGKNDPRVPYGEAQQVVEAVRKNGGPVWFLTALDEGHGFRKKTNADFQFLATVRFLEEHLLK